MSLVQETTADEKKENKSLLASLSSSNLNQADKIAPKSIGIRREELLTRQLTRKWQLGVYFFSIFIGMFVSVLETRCVNVFMSYATDSYKQHSLLTTINIVRSVTSVACLPAFAKLSDLFGRAPLFLFGLVTRVLGLVVMSQATNVQRYAGGMVLYSLGFSGTRVIFQFNLQDASSLKYRLLSLAVLPSPVIITTWASGDIVAQILERHNWKFGTALWAFTFPLTTIPYLACLSYMYLKARKTDAWKQINEDAAAPYRGKSKLGKIGEVFKEVFWKVDLMGCILVVLFLGLLLVPLTLAGGQSNKWKSGDIIVPLVCGFVCLPIFILWESKFAKYPFIPVVLLKDRGVWSAFIIGIFFMFAYTLPTSYSYPVLLVGMNATITTATRIPQLSSFVGAVTLPFVGLAVSRVRRTKGFILFGAGVWFIAMGLFIRFRGDNNGIDGRYYRNGVAAGMCVLGFGEAFLTRVITVSAQTCTNHEYMATVTAMFASLYQTGYAMGNCVAGAIWTQTMFKKIRDQMIKHGVDPTLAKLAYSSPYLFIKSNPWGSDARVSVVLAYAEVQRNLCIVGLCLCVPLFFFAFFLRDHYLTEGQSLDESVDEKGFIKREGKILFTDDDDKILNALKRLNRARHLKSSNT